MFFNLNVLFLSTQKFLTGFKQNPFEKNKIISYLYMMIKRN